MSRAFDKDTQHILDCPESNIPYLSKSLATLFTDQIKMVCPLLIPTYTNNIQDIKADLVDKYEKN